MRFNRIGRGTALVLAAALTVSTALSGAFVANAADEDLTGNTMLQADEITLGKVYSGDISNKIDNDWFVFTLTEPSKVNLSFATGASISYCAMKLIDGTHDNNVLYSSVDAKPLNATYYLTAGEYYFGLVNDDNSYNLGSTYDLKITATPCNLNVPGDGSNNALGDATAVEFETEYNAQISQNDTADYYTIDLSNDAYVTFNFSGAVNSADWALYDNQDDLIKHGIYQKKNTNDSKITESNSLRLKAGKYTVYLGANEKAPSYGQYTFSFNYSEQINDTAANGIIPLGDVNKDGFIDANDASTILVYYAYLMTGGTETDMEKWLADNS
ncbi:MAG TPA: hypothetical protein DCZ62_07575 [Ruminococcus sp.]|nr:hypothetical protein [Ruminococcus sp.]